MGNDEHGSAVHQSVHTVLHQFFRPGIDGGGGLVQNHYGRVGYRRPGNGNELPLALRQAGPIACEHRLVALRQAGDEVVGVCQLRRLDTLLIGGIQFTVADVVHHRTGEQIGFLQHHAQGSPQVGLGNLVDVDVVVADFAVGNVIEPVNQVRNGGLARAGGAYKGDFLAGMGVQGHIVQHRLLRHIAEVHVKHGDIALQLGIGHGTVRLVGMLPGPAAGALVGLGNVAVFINYRVDQTDVALILLRLLVHQLKDTLRTGQRHDDGIDLVGHLGDGHIEGTGQGQEADELAHGEQLSAGEYREQAADDGENRVLGVAQIVVEGPHGVGVSPGKVGIPPQLFVQRVKLFLAGILMGEDLHHPLAVDHFLHIAVDRAQRALLSDEKFGGFSRNDLGGKDDGQHGEQLQNRQNR